LLLADQDGHQAVAHVGRDATDTGLEGGGGGRKRLLPPAKADE
jgi:hypothetical protein